MAKEVVKATSEEVGNELPITYSQHRMCLHECLATGEHEGVQFEVHHSYDRVYVIFPNKLKGAIPNIGVNLRDLVIAAHKIAVEKNLLKP